tara:strand:- start:19712 stop:19969 length:258 start_codon:yes stop_codon:yes gene_type:complete
MPNMDEIEKAIREAEAAQAMPGMPDGAVGEPERVVVEFNGSGRDGEGEPSADSEVITKAIQDNSRDDVERLLQELIDVCRRGFDL